MALTTVNPAMIGQTSTGASSLTATGSASASLVTVAGTALSANSSGYVTMPYQVAFHVRVNNGTYITTSPVPFSNAVYNIGNAWNTSTYTFTAPVAGKYVFMFTGYIRVTNSGGGGNFQVLVNGSRRQYSDTSPGVATSYFTVPLTSIFNLSAGDTVSYTWGGSNTTYYGGNDEMNLFGYLLG